jgi:zinc finger SWIM domain-containing protein 3
MQNAVKHLCPLKGEEKDEKKEEGKAIEKMLSNIYVHLCPIIFESFQGEYERSMAAGTRVIGDPLTKTATCSCRMFNRTGILCGHNIKVLDLMNIKTLPTHYILKRWTREARNGSIQDRHGRKVVENPKLEAQLPLVLFMMKICSSMHKVVRAY